jgi:carboxylesterase
MSTPAYTLEGGPLGVLVLHGFTGTPGEMRPLADQLHRQGYTVHAPLLPGHGGLPEAMLGLPWQAWLRHVERAFDQLYSRCQQIVVIGQSMGGTLAILLATRRPVAGLVALATPLYIHDWRAKLVPLFRPVLPYWYPYKFANWDDPMVREQVLAFVPGANLDDVQTRQALGDTIRIPFGALDELMQLVNYTRRRVPFVSAPSLLLQGRHDAVTNPKDAYLLYGLLGAARKALVWYEQSGHLLLVDQEREAVLERIGKFVGELSNG